MDVTGKKLSELRVVDLRQILEKRGLEKSGNKTVLIERLSKALSDEGIDAGTFTFTLEEPSESFNDSHHSDSGFKQDDTANMDGHEGTDGNCEEEAIAEGGQENDYGVYGEESTAEEEESLEEGDKMVELDSLAEASDLKYEHNNGPASTDMSAKESGSYDKQENQDVDNTSAISNKRTSQQSENSQNVAVHETDANGSGDTSQTEASKTESSKNDKKPLSKPSYKASEEAEEQFVVHVDESDTNLDYDLGDKPEERDAPTPTKDEMDVDADLLQHGDPSMADNNQEGSGSKSGQASKSGSEIQAKDTKDLASSQNLWISGLSSTTRATDLKTVFSKYGKVIGAKVVTNANRPGAKCYGYVTMSTPEEAAKCIQNLHRSELHGRMISVEKAKTDPAAQTKTPARKASSAATDKRKEEVNAKEGGSGATKDETKQKTDSHRAETNRSRHRQRLGTSHSSSTTRGPAADAKSAAESATEKTEEEKSKEKKPEDPLEREKRRLRLRESRLKDDEMRNRKALLREKRMLAEGQRKLRLEESRIEREREKLRIDREKMKIEEIKLESLERERARLEAQLMDLRQRVDREREELKRVETLRIEEMRREAIKRPYDASNRSAGGRYDDGWESKRPATNDRYVGSTDRRQIVSERSAYPPERRSPPEIERRAVQIRPKDEVIDSRSRPDDRYRASTGSTERRDYPPSDRPRDQPRPDWKPSNDRSHASNTGRAWHETTRRSGGSNDRSSAGGSWGGASSSSSNAPNIVSAHSSSGPMFSGAAAHAADMMMNAAMSRNSSGANGSSARFGSGSGSAGAGNPAGYGGRRY